MMPSVVAATANRLIGHLDDPDAATWAALLQDIRALLNDAQREEDVSNADALWFLETVAKARVGMVNAYHDIANGAYKKAWDQLEQIEIGVANLIDNPILPLEPFQVRRLRDLVRSWQSLYPYRLFFSPEFLHKRVECSICGEDVGPWSSCNHCLGKVYCGKLCYHIVREVELLSISIVHDPVQKYSAIIPYTDDGQDPLNYQRVSWVHARLSGPFAAWHTVETSKIFPHERFNLSNDDICPCSSGMIYKSCCKPKSGIIIPHTEIHFSDEIPSNLSMELLVHPAATS